MKSFKQFLEQKSKLDIESFFAQLGLPMDKEGLQTKMSSLDKLDIRDSIERWSKFQDIKDEDEKKEILDMVNQPTTSLNDLFKKFYPD